MTALREYHLISGRHELKFWAVADRVPNVGEVGLAQTRANSNWFVA
ncbi:hypothetical protein R5W24_004955 [Gemmata sp. JC717]|nr:hypothetical protein [Gemmata algarum]MDY3555809.1 hypothetical protein [Gemmata algarum]